jgi:hypothetical protein
VKNRRETVSLGSADSEAGQVGGEGMMKGSGRSQDRGLLLEETHRTPATWGFAF